MTTVNEFKNLKKRVLIDHLVNGDNTWGNVDLTKFIYKNLLEINILEPEKVYNVIPTKSKNGYHLFLNDYLPLSTTQPINFKTMDGIVSFIDMLSGSDKYVAIYIKDKVIPTEEDYTNGNIITHIYSEQGMVTKRTNTLYNIDSDMENCIKKLVNNVKLDNTLKIVLFNKTVSLKHIFNMNSFKQLQAKTVVTNQLEIGNLLSLFLTTKD